MNGIFEENHRAINKSRDFLSLSSTSPINAGRVQGDWNVNFFSD